MLLNPAEAAKLLKVEEKDILHWIKKKDLPACKASGQLRLNRVDLLEWATEHGIKVSPEIFSADTAEGDNLPTLSAALIAGGIHRDVPGDDKQSVLANVVSRFTLPPQVDPEFLLQVLLAREALGTTAIGEGIAIPHVRNPILLQVQNPVVTLCFLRNPIDFKALDGIPVDTLFTLVTPSAQSHLHLLAKLAYALRDERFSSVLRKRGTSEELLSTLTIIENELGGTR